MLNYLDGTSFASGVTRCRYCDMGDGNTRIYLPVVVETVTVEMLLDTGSPWCILDPEVAQVIGLPDTITEHRAYNWIRGYRYVGTLCRATMEIPANCGVGLALEGTVFVPDSGQEYPFPNFLGLNGALERMRFALDLAPYPTVLHDLNQQGMAIAAPDPSLGLFYFGAVAE